MRPVDLQPTLRVVPLPSDINANGHIFGGWVLSQMDIGGGAIAHREAQGKCATVAIEAMKFVKPILVGDLISVYAWPERRGRTSVAVRMEVTALRDFGQTEITVTEGLFTYVAIDANGQPRPLPLPAVSESPAELA